MSSTVERRIRCVQFGVAARVAHAAVSRRHDDHGCGFDKSNGGRQSSHAAPALALAAQHALADEAIRVEPFITNNSPPPANLDLPMVEFAPYSAAGSELLLFRPAGTTSDGVAGPFSVNSKAFHFANEAAFDRVRPTPTGDDNVTELQAVQVDNLFEAVVLEGMLGRIAYLTSLEKQRILRTAREIRAMRFLGLARGKALDDHGADIGVPRLTDFDESDKTYRARLRIYRKGQLPTPRTFRNALNGPGLDHEDNRGLLAAVGVKSRFKIVEQDNELAVSFRVISVFTPGNDGQQTRQNFDNALKQAYLVDLQNPPPSDLPEPVRQRRDQVRQFLLQELTRPPGDMETKQFLAPTVAESLARLLRMLRAGNFNDPIELQQAFDPSGGSRYELGLGIALTRLPQALLELVRRSDWSSGKVGSRPPASTRGQPSGSSRASARVSHLDQSGLRAARIVGPLRSSHRVTEHAKSGGIGHWAIRLPDELVATPADRDQHVRHSSKSR